MLLVGVDLDCAGGWVDLDVGGWSGLRCCWLEWT